MICFLFLNNSSVENVVDERICLVYNNKQLLITTSVLNKGEYVIYLNVNINNLERYL